MTKPTTLTIPLDPPVEVAGGKLEVLKLREPTGKEMMGAEAAISGAITEATLTDFRVKLVSGVSGLTEDAVNLLPCSVFRDAHRFVEAFNGTAPATQPGPTLELPIGAKLTSGAVSYDRLTLREPTVGQRRKAEMALTGGRTAATGRRYQMILVSEASGVPYGLAEQLPVSVLNAAEAFVLGFIEGGPRTGNT